MQLADQFTLTFREEHRTVRDTLFELIQAFQARDKTRIQSLLTQAAAFVGPHFRYEEEALYPALVEVFGEDYIEKLLEDHDRAIGSAKRLVGFAGQDQLTAEDVAKATKLIRGIFPHVSDCDGLSIMVECLPEQKVQWVFQARDRAQTANLDLLQWADEVRGRPAVAPQ